MPDSHAQSKTQGSDSPVKLRLALSKGRLLDQTLPLLNAAGIDLLESPDKTRKLVLETNVCDVEVIIVRATDVPAYVEHGGADFGVVGKDVLLEHGGQGLYESLDLGIARCRLAVAGRPGTNLAVPRLRVASKYQRLASEYFAARRQRISLIKLYGSMELAPLVDLSDVIVDVVESGNTLRANGLVELETICLSSARLIVNKASAKIKHRRLRDIIEPLRAAVAASE